MTPAVCRVKHDPDAGSYGDCLRACVASILDMDADTVPHFYQDGCDAATAHARLIAFLAPLKLAPFIVHYPGSFARSDILDMMAMINASAYYLLFGQADGGGDHVVVCCGGAVAHNPAWCPTPLIGPGSHGMWSVMVLARS